MDTKPSRGWQGAVLRLLGAGEYRLTVTEKRSITDDYLRLSFSAGGLLGDRPVHPTMWIRLWFGHGHQRGYTVINPDRHADTFDIEFALHDGRAARWARDAQPGDTIEATVLGSDFALPKPAPRGYVLVGDSASLPAINTLLDAIGDSPVKVFLEAAHDDDVALPVSCADPVWINPCNGDVTLVDAVRSAAFEASGYFGWVACNSRTTREVARIFKDHYGIDRRSIKAQAYWMA